MQKHSLIQGFYSKMLLTSILILCTVSLILAGIVSFFVTQSERHEYLEHYEMSLSELNQLFYNKQKNFSSALSPLFDPSDNYQALTALLKTSSLDSLSYKEKVVLMKLLANINYRDEDCSGILLYSKKNNSIYQYDILYDTLVPLSLSSDFPDIQSDSPEILTDSVLQNLSPDFEKPASHIYGLVGTITDTSQDPKDVLGYIILLYDTSQMLETVHDVSGNSECIYSLIRENGDLIFRSSGDFSLDSDLYTPSIDFNGSSTITLPSHKVTIGQDVFYSSSIANGRYRYIVTYQVPASIPSNPYTRLLIIALSLFTCLFSILLYILTFKRARRKVAVIERGMDIIGQNNLDYRLKPDTASDEFARIIRGFNRMCDELQSTVEKTYIQELQQKKAELFALQTSINPHFLYNTLEVIRLETVHGHTAEASQMILLLSRIYRNQLHQETYVSIFRELESCENLIELYQYRFSDIDYDFQIPREWHQFGLPKNSLQPLIENYFQHGFDRSSSDNAFVLYGDTISIEGETFLRLCFEDNGQSMTPRALESLKQTIQSSIFNTQAGHGFALTNIHQRFRLLFGNHCGLFPEIPSDGKGFKVTIILRPIPPDHLSKLMIS